MKKNSIFIRLIGIIMAIVGAVIVVHTVPVFIWYGILILLVFVLLYLLLNQ